MKPSAIVHHATGTIEFKGNLYRYIIREGAEIDYQSAIELVKIGTDLTAGQRVVSLVDARALFTASSDARQYFALHSNPQQFAAIAIITNNLASRLIINFYIGINKPNIPTKLFGSEESALQWLNTFVNVKE